ncbi:MAG: hypothetical protein Kow0049_16350 [Stanieria sp.]
MLIKLNTNKSNQFQSILDGLTTQVAILDQTGKIVATNQAWKSNSTLDLLIKNASLGENYLNLCKSANNSEQETIKSLIKAIEEIINHQREEFKLEYSSDRHNQKKWFIINLKKLSDGDNQLVYMSFNHPKAIEVIQRFQEIDARRHFNQHISSDYTLADTNVWGILNPVYQSLQKQLWQIMRQAELKVGIELLQVTKKELLI